MTLESIERLRESLNDCTTEAGVEPNRFDTYWITARACDILIDDIEREIAEKYMELPVDADGVPIHVGEKVKFRSDGPITVMSIGMSQVYGLNDCGFYGPAGQFFGSGTFGEVCHVKPRTVEDVLEEFLRTAVDACVETNCKLEEQIARYANELRDLIKEGEL